MLNKLIPFQFRNLSSQVLDFAASRNIFFIGKNGQGKTNFLESIYYLSYGKSFRVNSDSSIYYNEAEEKTFSVFGELLQEDLSHKVFIEVKKSKKTITINKKEISNKKDLIFLCPSIVFSHGDMQLISGSADFQRMYIDQTICLSNGAMLESMQLYRQLLKRRNIAIREEMKQMIFIYDEQLIEQGIKIMKEREETVKELSKNISVQFANIFPFTEQFSLSYEPSWEYNDKEKIRSIMQKNLYNDLLRKHTILGPHRDKILINIGETAFKHVGSTGQMRLAALLFRMGQLWYISNKTKRMPLLLFDDVLLELDRDKRVSFLQNLPKYEQAFFTFLPEERYSVFEEKQSLMYTVENGTAIKNG